MQQRRRDDGWCCRFTFAQRRASVRLRRRAVAAAPTAEGTAAAVDGRAALESAGDGFPSGRRRRRLKYYQCSEVAAKQQLPTDGALRALAEH
jgi:hypothetical protein